MNKPERYILGVKEMKHLKELGLKMDEEDSAMYWVKFVQTQGKRKCHKWKKSVRSARVLNRRCPQYGHYVGMPAYTMQQVIQKYVGLGHDNVWSLTAINEKHVDGYFKIAYEDLCRALANAQQGDKTCQK